MTQIRWKNALPPSHPMGGYQILKGKKWCAISAEDVKALERNGEEISWNSDRV